MNYKWKQFLSQKQVEGKNELKGSMNEEEQKWQINRKSAQKEINNTSEHVIQKKGVKKGCKNDYVSHIKNTC